MGLALGYVPQGCVFGLEVKIWDLKGGIKEEIEKEKFGSVSRPRRTR